MNRLCTVVKNQAGFIFRMNSQQGPTYCIGHGTLLSVRTDGRGVCRRMDINICLAESLRCSPEATTTLLIGYTAVQNKKLKNKQVDFPIRVHSKLVVSHLEKLRTAAKAVGQI